MLLIAPPPKNVSYVDQPWALSRQSRTSSSARKRLVGRALGLLHLPQLCLCISPVVGDREEPGAGRSAVVGEPALLGGDRSLMVLAAAVEGFASRRDHRAFAPQHVEHRLRFACTQPRGVGLDPFPVEVHVPVAAYRRQHPGQRHLLQCGNVTVLVRCDVPQPLQLALSRGDLLVDLLQPDPQVLPLVHPVRRSAQLGLQLRERHHAVPRSPVAVSHGCWHHPR